MQCSFLAKVCSFLSVAPLINAPSFLSSAKLFQWFSPLLSSLKIWQKADSTVCVLGNDLVGYLLFSPSMNVHIFSVCVQVCVCNWLSGPTTESDTRRWDSLCSWQDLSDYRGANSLRSPNLIRQGERKGFQCGVKKITLNCLLKHNSLSLFLLSLFFSPSSYTDTVFLRGWECLIMVLTLLSLTACCLVDS